MLGFLDVSETATRATLSRMARSGLLDRAQSGRVATYGITHQAEALLREGRERVTSQHPFTPGSDAWTLLSYSLPESKRDQRHQLRSRLSWAGFGRVRDGLWIAPGEVDVRDVLPPIEAADAMTVTFVGRPSSGTTPRDFITTAWDLDAIRREHHRFISSWSQLGDAPANPVASFTALGSAWLRLLRSDPGLPADCLPADWPAHESVSVHAAAVDALERRASDMLDHMMMSRSNRK